MKTPLGTEVDLGTVHIVLDGVPVFREIGTAAPPLFGPCLLWPWSPISATAELLFTSHILCLYSDPLPRYSEILDENDNLMPYVDLTQHFRVISLDFVKIFLRQKTSLSATVRRRLRSVLLIPHTPASNRRTNVETYAYVSTFVRGP